MAGPARMGHGTPCSLPCLPVAIEDHRSPPIGRPFTLLWLGQAISQLGDYIAYFTLPAFVSVLTSRATDFALVFAAENVPTLLFGFSAGVLLDRVSLRAAALVADLGRALAFAMLAVFAASGAPSIWILFLVSFAVGTLAAGFNAALPSFLPAVVAPDRVTSANARLSFTQQLAFVVAPAIGGLIVQAWGFTVAFIINAATFIASVISLMFVKAQRVMERAEERTSFSDELKEGLRYLWQHPVLKPATLAAAATNLVVAFIESMLVLLGREVFGIEDFARLGIVFGALGAGGVVGAATASRIIQRLGLGRTLIIGMFVFGLGTLATALQRTVPGVAVSLGAALIGVPWINIAIITMRQTMTPDALLGRVTSASRSIAWGTLPIGAVIAGLLADEFVGLETLTYAAPVFLLGVAALMLRTELWSGHARPAHDGENMTSPKAERPAS